MLHRERERHEKEKIKMEKMAFVFATLVRMRLSAMHFSKVKDTLRFSAVLTL